MKKVVITVLVVLALTGCTTMRDISCNDAERANKQCTGTDVTLTWIDLATPAILSLF
jgi:uncharacterized protein YceK